MSVAVGACRGNTDGKQNNCIHEIQISSSNSADNLFEDEEEATEKSLIWSGKQIYQYLKEHRITEITGDHDYEHFHSRYKDASVKGQKKKHKYNKISKEEKKQTEETEEDSKELKHEKKKKKEGGEEEGKEKKEKKHRVVLKAKRKTKEKNKKTKEKKKNEIGLLRVQNVVGKGLTTKGINHDLIKFILNGKYDDSTFPASTVHICNMTEYEEEKNKEKGGRGKAKFPSISYASSGAINAAGPRSRHHAILSANLFSYMLALKLQQPFELRDVGPVNFATTVDMGREIDLRAFERKYKGDFTIKYNVTKFKGLHCEMPQDNVVMILFGPGKVNIVGLKSEHHVKMAQENIVPWLMDAINDLDPSSSSSSTKEEEIDY